MNRFREKLFVITCFTLILASMACGPGESPGKKSIPQDILTQREQKEAVPESQKIRTDAEKSMEWEPEFFIIPESRLGTVADECPAIPPDLTPDEDLWIIVRRSTTVTRSVGTHMGVSIHDDQGVDIPLISRHTSIDSRIMGCVADIVMNHRFTHESEHRVDLVYSIVLPDNAGMSDFMVCIGDRTIRGIIRERDDAERIFNLARKRGLIASLVEDSGENLIEGRIHSVPPGTEMISTFRYVSTLPYQNGSYRFICPLTVMQSDSSVHGSAGAAVSITLEAGMPIRAITSTTHELEIVNDTPHSAEIRSLASIVSSPSEFVMEYDITGDETQAALFVDRSSNPGHGVILLIPPRELGGIPRLPVDMAILLDCSRSMRGKKLYTAKKAAEYLLENLNANDVFRVTTFSGYSLTDFQGSSEGSDGNIREAIRRIHAAPPSDGENILPGLQKSLTMSPDSTRYRILILLTDGYMDDRGDLLKFLESNLNDTRVFPLVVGQTAHTGLLENMARFGRGGLLFLGADNIRHAIDSFIETVRRPVLRDITVEWEAIGGTQSLPVAVPDLHVGRPLVIAARISATATGWVTITGSTETGINRMNISERDYSSDAPALGFLWARKRLSSLMHSAVLSPTPDFTDEIKEIALRYGIISPFTSFLMVDTRSNIER